MSARMQFCGRFPGLRAVSGIWSGAAADSLSLGSKRSGCVGLQSTQPKHRRVETVRLSAPDQVPVAARSLRERPQNCCMGGQEALCRADGRSRSRAEFVGLRGGRQSAPAELLPVRGGGQSASVEQLSVRGGGQGVSVELLSVCGGGQGVSVEQLSVCGGGQSAPAELLPGGVGRLDGAVRSFGW